MNVINTISSLARKTKFNLKAKSPEILIATGVVGIVTGTVLACRATLKAKDILEEHKKVIDEINEVKEQADAGNVEDYSEQDYKKDITTQYIQTGIKLTKEFALPVVLISGGIGTCFASNGILKKRYASVSAAYTAVNGAFSNYRKNVVESLGSEADQQFRFGLQPKKIEDTVTDENGKDKKIKKLVDEVTGSLDDFSTFFDESCYEWDRNADYNFSFLIGIENILNQQLIRDGYLFVSDVYDAIGVNPETIPSNILKASRVAGWIYDTEMPIGIKQVDLGVTNVKRERVKEFAKGFENVILLDICPSTADVYGSMQDIKKKAKKLAREARKRV